ncbi:MAG: 3-phosphoshikimate 1-carboxyvinyltransferase [Clostridia bacterium]|jgi:3-phosphoshikimate 1-carboxyvinyltransferase
MMQVTVYPSKLKGTLFVPPSKSQAHRLLLAAVPSKEPCVIDSVAFSDDISATVGAMEALGKKIDMKKGDFEYRLTVQEGTLTKNPVINCKESGSTLRFAIPLALAVAGEATFTGEGRLGERPLNVYKDLLEKQGILWEADVKGLPLHVKGELMPGIYSVPGDISSQFITGLLLALPLLKGDSVLTIEGVLESAPYVDITVDVLKKYGVRITEEEPYRIYRIPGGQTFGNVNAMVEGDWSQAAFYILSGLFGNGVLLKGLDKDSYQGDKRIVFFLRSMGGDIRWTDEGLMAYPSELKGVDMDISHCPDLAPVLALACSVAKGCSRISGAKRLRIKESDRIESVGNTLKALGAKIECLDDGFFIEGSEALNGGKVFSYKDHRIAMMAAVAACVSEEPIVLEGAEAVKKSYPNFWEDYKMLGGIVE